MKASAFSKALLYHLEWKVQFRRFLDGKGDMEESQIVSPAKCRFGKWLYSDAITKYVSNREIREIEKLHTELHKTAKRIYELKISGDGIAARQELKKMDATCMKLVSLLTAMKL
jgi:hypothetical protein